MVGLRLQELRINRKLSQIQLADELNLSNQAISFYETGKREMNYDMLCKVSTYFHVTVDYLLGREDEKPSYLTEHERQLIKKYQALSEYSKDTVDNCLNYEYLRATKKDSSS